MKSRWMIGELVLLISSAVGPTTGAAQAQTAEGTTRAPEDMILRVDNDNRLDTQVYVSRAGGPQRSMGMVTALDSKVFHIPPDLAVAGYELRVVAEPIGGSGIYVSPPVLANSRNEIVVSLENDQELTHTSVGPRRDS